MLFNILIELAWCMIKYSPFIQDGELKMIKSESQPRPVKIRKLTPEQIAIKRRKIMVSIAKKEVPKVWIRNESQCISNGVINP